MIDEPRRRTPVLIDMENLKLSLREGEILLDHLLGQGVDIAHDCGGVLACTSCRVVIREGSEHLQDAEHRGARPAGSGGQQGPERASRVSGARRG